jgi:hypothetical protein
VFCHTEVLSNAAELATAGRWNSEKGLYLRDRETPASVILDKTGRSLEVLSSTTNK